MNLLLPPPRLLHSTRTSKHRTKAPWATYAPCPNMQHAATPSTPSLPFRPREVCPQNMQCDPTIPPYQSPAVQGGGDGGLTHTSHSLFSTRGLQPFFCGSAYGSRLGEEGGGARPVAMGHRVVYRRCAVQAHMQPSFLFFEASSRRVDEEECPWPPRRRLEPGLVVETRLPPSLVCCCAGCELGGKPSRRDDGTGRAAFGAARILSGNNSSGL